jgi:adenylyl-sulfate kinase
MSKGFTLWFTGLSGAGKSTLAEGVAAELEQRGRLYDVLDGDEVRTHLSKGLGFSKEDRDTNIKRIGWVASKITKHGGIAITAAISPYRATRDWCRALISQQGGFIEAYCAAPLEACEERDVKGLYKKARAGEIQQFTGIDDPYEPPLNPEVILETHVESVAESTAKIIRALERLGCL